MAGEAGIQNGADGADVVLGIAWRVGVGVEEHDPAVVGDQDRAGMDVAVHDARGVQRGDRLGDRVGHQDGPFRVERALTQYVAQGEPGYPFAHQVGTVALVDGVVDRNEVRMYEPARGHGHGQHSGSGLAARLADDQCDRPAQNRVHPTPDLAAGGVGVDVLLEAVAVDENLAGGRRTEGHDARHTRRLAGSGPTPIAFVAHPSSSRTPLSS